MTTFWISLTEFSWIDMIDVLLVSVLIYYFYIEIAKTRVLPVFQGIIIIIVFTMVTSYLKLTTMSYIFDRIADLLFFAIVILFPSEIRQGLYQIGQRIFRLKRKHLERDNLNILIAAAIVLARQKIGAIIIIEKNDRLEGLTRSGSKLNATIDEDLLVSLFQKTSPLHDGAVIVGNNKILSAGCYVPFLSTDIAQTKGYGSRHRAALGISEQSDAVAVIVSEEKKKLGLAYNSRLYPTLTEKGLRDRLYRIYGKVNSGKVVKKTKKK